MANAATVTPDSRTFPGTPPLILQDWIQIHQLSRYGQLRASIEQEHQPRDPGLRSLVEFQLGVRHLQPVADQAATAQPDQAHVHITATYLLQLARDSPHLGKQSCGG
jgi:hypothetical protein